MAALHQRLDELAKQYCPVVAQFGLSYHWSIMQAEYATDIIFKNQTTLQAIYPHLLETLIQVVKPTDTIYSLPALAQTLQAVNLRYLKFLSTIDTPENGVKNLQKLAETSHKDNRRYKGFNLLAEEDASLFRLLLDGAFSIQGFSNRLLRYRLPNKNSGQITRLLKRPRVHGFIKTVRQHYRYYLTDLGRQVATLALTLRQRFIIPSLAGTLALSA